MAKRQILHNSRLKVGEYYFVRRWERDNNFYYGRMIDLKTIVKLTKVNKTKIPARWYARGYTFRWNIEFQELTKDGKLRTVNNDKIATPHFYPFTFKRALELLPKYKPKDKAQRQFLREALKAIASELTS